MFLHNPKRKVFGMEVDGNLISIQPGVNEVSEELYAKAFKAPRFKQKMITEQIEVMTEDPIMIRSQFAGKIHMVDPKHNKAEKVKDENKHLDKNKKKESEGK